MYTDHSNDASRQYEPSHDAQGQLTERTTLNIEDNYVVFHQYEFSCEFSVWMGYKRLCTLRTIIGFISRVSHLMISKGSSIGKLLRALITTIGFLSGMISGVNE